MAFFFFMLPQYADEIRVFRQEYIPSIYVYIEVWNGFIEALKATCTPELKLTSCVGLSVNSQSVGECL